MFKVYYKYGTMNAGKSAELLMNAHNYESKGVKAIYVAPKIDTRSNGNITARIGLSHPANMVIGNDASEYDLTMLAKKAYDQDSPIMIDEAQFLSPGIIHTLVQKCRELDLKSDGLQNFSILAYGLLLDFNNRLFEGSKAWVEEADSLHEIKTVCKYCGNKATRNLLTTPIDDSDSDIHIGDEEFESVCSYHYYLYNKRRNK